MPGAMRRYLDTPAKPKYPVGKIAGVDSHSYNGSHLMHKLVQHAENVDGAEVTWRLACRPTKVAIYSYMGFREAVTCHICRNRTGSLGGSGNDDAAA